jgi:hypothetical protein
VPAAVAGRKTRESVPTDSRRRGLRRVRPTACRVLARENFGSVSAHAESDARFCFAPERSGIPVPSRADFFPQKFVDGLRIGLAARRLHHLADEPADRLRIRPRVGELVRILGDDIVDQFLDRADVDDLS